MAATDCFDEYFTNAANALASAPAVGLAPGGAVQPVPYHAHAQGLRVRGGRVAARFVRAFRTVGAARSWRRHRRARGAGLRNGRRGLGQVRDSNFGIVPRRENETANASARRPKSVERFCRISFFDLKSIKVSESLTPSHARALRHQTTDDFSQFRDRNHFLNKSGKK